MTKKFTYVEKQEGDALTAAEWNNLAQDVSAAVDSINNPVIYQPTGNGSDHIVFDSADKHNLTISTTAEDQYQDGNKTKGGKINIEPISDLQIKSGDDIMLCSHHREDPTEVSVKVVDGNDNPVKLQLNAANIVLTTKDKSKTKEKDENGEDTSTALYDDPNVMNVTVNSAKNTRGYLKVRAQAIDLRCEDHGGIALQPKGDDGHGHENKIKFEHDGGDGKEFGTFNTEHTSIFTNDYRFNEAGTVYAVTRGEVSPQSYKEDGVTPKKIDYPTQADDFKDVIDETKGATWGAIVNTANALNGADGIGTKITNKGNLEIESKVVYKLTEVTVDDKPEDVLGHSVDVPDGATDILYTNLDNTSKENCIATIFGADVVNDLNTNGESYIIDTNSTMHDHDQIDNPKFYHFVKISRNINIESDNKIKISADTVEFEKSSISAKKGNATYTCPAVDIVNTASAMNNDQIETRIADYESIGKRGLLISGRKCVRVISNSRSEIQALIDNSDPSVDQVSISTDNETTAEILSDTYAPFTGTFPVGEILDIEKLKYTAGRYTGLEASLYELSLHDNGYKKIIYFTNSQDVALFLEVVTYDITFATEQPFPYNLQNPDTDPLWPEHSVSVSDLIKLVEWFKKPANISNMGSVNPFNVQSNP